MSIPPADRRYRVSRFCIVTHQAQALASFYEGAFGSRHSQTQWVDAPEGQRLFGTPGVSEYVTTYLGKERIDFVQFKKPGRPYPKGASAAGLSFQHFAIVVAEMGLALQHLCKMSGWSPITREGPQHLPRSSGGVTAFKFRDPEGHPLEFLQFPRKNTPPKWQGAGCPVFRGIDHSAISIRESAVSEQFYSKLGFSVCAKSLNSGPEQERLDNIANALVEVTALSSGARGPHIELLCYRGVRRTRATPSKDSDIAATRLILDRDNASANIPRKLLDPDGHRLLLIDQPGRGTAE